MELDYDLHACLEYNPQEGFTAEDIITVLAVIEGERDQSDWHWIVKLSGKNRYALIVGGCDYTGWDCQSSAVSVITKTAKSAASRDASPIAHAELLRQLQGGKKTTWRELTEQQLGQGRILPIVTVKP